MSARTEALVLEGIARLDDRFDRMLLGTGPRTLIDGLIDVLAPTPGVRSIEPAGSFRRRRESIGDLDLLAETDQPAGAHRRVHVVRAGRLGHQPGRLQGGRPAACADRRST